MFRVPNLYIRNGEETVSLGIGVGLVSQHLGDKPCYFASLYFPLFRVKNWNKWYFFQNQLSLVLQLPYILLSIVEISSKLDSWSRSFLDISHLEEAPCNEETHPFSRALFVIIFSLARAEQNAQYTDFLPLTSPVCLQCGSPSDRLWQLPWFL